MQNLEHYENELLPNLFPLRFKIEVLNGLSNKSGTALIISILIVRFYFFLFGRIMSLKKNLINITPHPIEKMASLFLTLKINIK